MSQRLTTRTEYDAMTPAEQGWVVYMEANWPGSELRGLTNPYPEGSKDHGEWERGEFRAILAVMDAEE